jgi:hypothetical protein
MRHHREVGHSGSVDFDSYNPLLSRQFHNQAASARARLKNVIGCSYCGQIQHSVRQVFGCLEGCQAIPCRSRSPLQDLVED